ncbi:type IV secretion system protein [Edaphobacter flagellatus]|uniref:type IV secretion system protein n=1 Tax=Edaphobacter flagellatus TaxID=1933044 RepID=UPI0021B4A887|nr:type IV secretion system protein [Edaphobacter flagellatus]
MGQNYLTFLSQAINELLSAHSAALQATGRDIFRGLATILVVWFGVKAALSASQGHGGFHFAKFADLILMIAFGLGMLTYYSTPIPGTSYSFSDLITKEAIQISAQIQTDNAQDIVDSITSAEQQLGTPPGLFSPQEDLAWLIAEIALAIMQAFVFAVIAYGYVATAVCVLVGPIFIPWFIVPKMDWLFWGWLKAFIGFSFYQVVASAFIFVFSKVIIGMFHVIGTLDLTNIVTLLPALLTLAFVCVYGLHKIPELTGSILGGRAGTWVDLNKD